MRTGGAAVAAARACVGARFRPHGRSVEHGLDCVGVAALAYGVDAPGGYALRGGQEAVVVAALAAAGFVGVERAAAGDLLLVRAGFAQWHLGVRTEGAFVQAHAGLRRVVETPGWPEGLVGVWRGASSEWPGTPLGGGDDLIGSS